MQREKSRKIINTEQSKTVVKKIKHSTKIYRGVKDPRYRKFISNKKTVKQEKAFY